MKINLDNTFYLCSNPQCWSINKFNGYNDKGEEKWENIGYYQNPGNAIKNLANLEIRSAEATTLAEAIDKVNKIEEKWNNVLTTALTEIGDKS